MINPATGAAVHTSEVLPNCECPLQLTFPDPVNMDDEVTFPNGWAGRVVYIVGSHTAMVKPRPA